MYLGGYNLCPESMHCTLIIDLSFLFNASIYVLLLWYLYP
jgi:hypothetical protein